MAKAASTPPAPTTGRGVHEIDDAEMRGLKQIAPTGRRGEKAVGMFTVDCCGIDPVIAARLYDRGLARIDERFPKGRRVQFIEITPDGEAALAVRVNAEKAARKAAAKAAAQ